MMQINIEELDKLTKIAQGKYEDPIKSTIKNSIGANCTILLKTDDEEWTGSGFHVGDGYIGTVSHVVPPEIFNENYDLTVSFDGVDSKPAKIIFSDPNSDTAIIRSNESKNEKTVVMGNSDHLEVGDIIAVIGSPEGWHDTANVGRVTNMKQDLGEEAPSPSWNDMIFVDADILQGSSGGMVIATDGKLYGIVMGVTGQHADVGVGQNAIVPINKLKKNLSILTNAHE
jgi:S1-C subfamily serine protease